MQSLNNFQTYDNNVGFMVSKMDFKLVGFMISKKKNILN